MSAEVLVTLAVVLSGIVGVALRRLWRGRPSIVAVLDEDTAGILGVIPAADGTWAGVCSCSFTTRGWPSEDQAAHRLAQHELEHRTGQPMDDVVNGGSLVGRLG